MAVKQKDAILHAIPQRALQGIPMLLRGRDWPDQPTKFLVDGAEAVIEAVLEG